MNVLSLLNKNISPPAAKPEFDKFAITIHYAQKNRIWLKNKIRFNFKEYDLNYKSTAQNAKTETRVIQSRPLTLNKYKRANP